MTALSQYERLESTGLWREGHEARRREVMVAFRDASLVISDSRSDVPLAHWSLPAVVRLNPGETPALYAPGEEAGETLELSDETMIAAVDKVHRLIEARKPHPGRLRSLLLGGALLAILIPAIFWLPGEMVRHTASVVPMAKRQEIGRAILDDITRVSGAPCAAGQGPKALERLTDRLLGAGAGTLIVLPGGVTGARHLPGKVILLGRDLVEDHESPEIAAGFILAERLRAETADPLRDYLNWAGFRATFRLLTTGAVPDSAVQGYGRVILASAPPRVADADLIAWFDAAGVPSSPFAYSLDPSGETVLGLIEADPYAATEPPEPVMADGDWVALQGICGE